MLWRAADDLAPTGTILVVGYDRANATAPRASATRGLLFSAEEIADHVAGLQVERAEQLRIGEAVDEIVRAQRPGQDLT